MTDVVLPFARLKPSRHQNHVVNHGSPLHPSLKIRKGHAQDGLTPMRHTAPPWRWKMFMRKNLIWRAELTKTALEA